MRIQFDLETGSLYLRLGESPIIGSEEVYPGIVLDFDEADRVGGIEVLNIEERTTLADLKRLRLEMGRGGERA